MTSQPKRFRVVLADDEPMGRLSVKSLLGRDSEVEVVAECANGLEAVKAVREHKPDILFLDIQMPGMGGFDVVEFLEEDELPVIVFATAFDQFALDAFNVSAVDYILKPFDDERFALALARAKERAGSPMDRGELVADLLTSYGETISKQQEEEGGPTHRLTILREGGMDLIDTADLLWVEAADQYVELHTKRGVFLMRESMGKLERLLDPEVFQRIHRSAIVRLSLIRTLERHSGGTGRVLVDDDSWLPVSRSRLVALKARLA